MMILIVNPVSGQGAAMKAEESLTALLKSRNVEYRLVHTERVDHGTQLARELAHKGDTIVSVGGDGLASEVLRGLEGTGAALGIVPCGTGNDFIKTLGTPKDPVKALEFILDHEPRQSDACYLNGKPFLNVCGSGFDVSVLENAEAQKKRFKGLLPYLIGLIKAIREYEPIELRLEMDGQAENRRLLICSVDNGRWIGGGIPICPIARVGDGYLDVTLVQGIRRNIIWYHIPGLLLGHILKWKGITEHYLCRHVVMEGERMKVNIDGEIVTMDRAEFTVKPGELLLYRAE